MTCWSRPSNTPEVTRVNAHFARPHGSSLDLGVKVKGKRMRSNFLRRPIAALLGVGLLTVGFALSTYSKATHSHEQQIQLISWHSGVTNQEVLRICIGDLKGTSQSGARPAENISLFFGKIQSQQGFGVWEVNFSVPLGEFRCADISHEELVRAGLVPEPTSRIQFLVVISAVGGSSSGRDTVGSAQRVTVGALETITIGGQTVMYVPFKKSYFSASTGDQ